MKYIIILGDGMADHPIAALGNKTPLMAANKPHIDRLAAMGRTGLLSTVPLDMPPGSEIANMAVLGYDVKKVYQGRGVVEAASMGIELDDDDLAMRCNLICIEEDIIKNHSAGHISNEEANILINTLQKELGSDTVTFYPGVSYRHLLVIKGGKNTVLCTPPHDVPGTPFKEVLVQAAGNDKVMAEKLNSLIVKSQEILKHHPVNIKRKAEGKDPANSIWPWSPGHKPQMETLQNLYGISGAIISAVDLLYGIGKYAGMKPIKVPGSTGLYNTNYEGKAKAAVEALKTVDLVYLHIEASDEAGHEGDHVLKTKTIEYLDQRVVKYIMDETAKMNEPVTLALLPDYPTPCELRTHTHNPVPFIIYHPGETPDEVTVYNEASVKNGYYGLIKGDGFMRNLLAVK
ncbi:MAG: cofactor-independent phosphoglycerate mutase [Bacteroidales bacterium]|nr:cofactor-independent phosphoglycerate mutase [Bacteroidales bacterium]